MVDTDAKKDVETSTHYNPFNVNFYGMSMGGINLYTQHASDIFIHFSLPCMALGSKNLD